MAEVRNDIPATEALEKDRNKVELFGKDVGKIPCFRNSFLYGICSGFASGILHFAITSKVRAATNFAVWTYGGVTFTYWCYCRYDFSVTSFKYRQIKYALQQNAAVEGSDKDVYHMGAFNPQTNKPNDSTFSKEKSKEQEIVK